MISRAALNKAAVVATIGLSLVAMAGGVALLAFYFVRSNPWLVLALGLVLATQGSFALTYALGGIGGQRSLARWMLLAGSAAAVLVGLVGFGIGFAANVAQANADPEFGPMTVALLIAAHGAVSLLAFGHGADGRARRLRRSS